MLETEKGNLKTYPIKRLRDNLKYISLVYTLLNDHIKLKIPIHPAGEWLLDNFYIIEEAENNVERNLTKKKYKNLPQIKIDYSEIETSLAEKSKEIILPRVYILSSNIIKKTDGKIEKNELINFINEFQNQRELTMEEIWNIPLFLQICLIEKTRKIAEKIFISQMQKFKVEMLIHTMINDERKSKDIKAIKNNNGINSYSYIEYMSFKLKQMGEKAEPFKKILENEVNKTGTRVYDVIKRNHFNMAITTLSMKNSITSLKKIERMDIQEIFEKTSITEKILGEDPAKIYSKMDSETKSYYRNALIKISRKVRLSEIYVASKIVELCKNKENQIETCNSNEENVKNKVNIEKEKHIGYYLIDDGKNEIEEKLLNKKLFSITNTQKSRFYIFTIYLLTNLAIILMFPKYKILSIILAIPIQNIVTKIVQLILSKTVKPKLIPKINIEELEENEKTLCVCPTILRTEKDVQKMFDKLEVYYLANRSKNLYFALLGDCTSENVETKKEDKEISEKGIEKAQELNKKYGNVFFFFYRKREWNTKEKCFMGWERKRGLLTNLNEFLIIGKNRFLINTACEFQEMNHKVNKKREEEKKSLQKIKYVITIDEDTNLVLGSVKKMVGAMEHILNKPEIDLIKNRVTKGHAIIQPRIAIDRGEAFKTKFSKLFSSEMSGLDIYTNAISDVYQDNFDEGIYTGKGIYDVNIFYKLLNNQIEENSVLSHDLLEGSILRCALSSDIVLLDSFPSNYNSFKTRKSRWIRGDAELIPYLFNKRNLKLNLLSKYKILDNLNRNLNEAMIFICLIIAVIWKKYLLLPFLILGVPEIINIIKYFVASILGKRSYEIIKRSGIIKLSYIENEWIYGAKKLLLRFIGIFGFGKYGIFYLKNLKILFLKSARNLIWKNLKEYLVSLLCLPDMAFLELSSTAKAIYRTYISHQNMLEWKTAKEAETDNRENKKENEYLKFKKKKVQKINSYIKNSKFQIATSIVLLFISSFILVHYENADKIIFKTEVGLRAYMIVIMILCMVWLFMPYVMYKLEEKSHKEIKVRDDDRKYLLHIAKLTWNFFKENLINNLPIDNFQDDRKEKKAMRTSPTNIGMYLMAVVSSYDLKLENLGDTIKRIENTVETIEKLPKWNGNLYNWYDLNTLKAIYPYDISSVDSGNFVGYLITTKEFLKECINTEVKNEQKSKENISNLILRIEKIINETDFSKLYNKENGLFSIGFNVEQNKLYDSYYDLLASEARQTSLIAIAKKWIPEKHFQTLGRTLKEIDGKKCLASWGGTAFEYLMPNINIKTYPKTLLEDSQKMLVKSQMMYAKELGIPWGISEAAFSVKDFNGNYQYKTFGVPWLGLRRNLENDAVVSPYSTMLSLTTDYENSIKNLKVLEKEGAIGKYGFYESIDYKNKKELVKTFMAHHQGMIISSIDNLLNDNIFQKRFFKDKEIQGIEILLQEKMPETPAIKEKKNKKIKIEETNLEKPVERTTGANAISTNNLTSIRDGNKNGLLKYEEILLNEGQNLYVKNVETNDVIDFNKIKNEKSKIRFLPYNTEFTEQNGSLKVTEETTIAPLSEVEIIKTTLENRGVKNQKLELTFYEEPILSNKNQFEAHKVFDKMFLTFSEENVENKVRNKAENLRTIEITRKKRNENEKIVYEFITLLGKEEFEYEIEKDNFIERGNFEIPKAVKISKPLSSKIQETVNPILALKVNLNLDVDEKKEIYFIRSVNYDEKIARENLKEYIVKENLERVFELSKSQTMSETRYMNLTEKEVAKYQKNIAKLIANRIDNDNINQKNKNENKLDSNSIKIIMKPDEKEKLWKFGISGDYPIIIVKIRDYNDSYLINEAYKMYSYYKAKNIYTEMCIITDKVDITLSSEMQKNLNKRKGIFIVKNPKKEDKNIIEKEASITISTLTFLTQNENYN